VDDSVSAVRAGRGVPLPAMLGIIRAEDRDVPSGEGDFRGLLQSATGAAGGIRAQAGARCGGVRSEAGGRDERIQAEARGAGAFDEASGQDGEAERHRRDVHIERPGK